MTASATIYVVDDDATIRESLSYLLESDGFRVRAYDCAESMLADGDMSHDGCVLIDLRMPGMSGLQLQRALTSRNSALPVIFITGHGDTTSAVRAMKDGAFDFLEKPFSPEQLLSSVRSALARGETEARRRANSARARKLLDRLTAREREVLMPVVEGRVSRDIADRLGISARTVEAHRNRIMQKLEVRNVAELVRLVVSATNGDHVEDGREASAGD